MKYYIFVIVFIISSCSSTEESWRNPLPEDIVSFDYSEKKFRGESIIPTDYSESYLDKICANIACYFLKEQLIENLNQDQIIILKKSINCYFILQENNDNIYAIKQNFKNILCAILQKNDNYSIVSCDNSIGIFYRNCFPGLFYDDGVGDENTPFLVNHVAKSLKRNNIKIAPQDPLGQKNILIYIERPEFELKNKDKNIYGGFQYIGILDNKNETFADCYIYVEFSVKRKAHVFYEK